MDNKALQARLRSYIRSVYFTTPSFRNKRTLTSFVVNGSTFRDFNAISSVVQRYFNGKSGIDITRGDVHEKLERIGDIPLSVDRHFDTAYANMEQLTIGLPSLYFIEPCFEESTSSSVSLDEINAMSSIARCNGSLVHEVFHFIFDSLKIGSLVSADLQNLEPFDSESLESDDPKFVNLIGENLLLMSHQLAMDLVNESVVLDSMPFLYSESVTLKNYLNFPTKSFDDALDIFEEAMSLEYDGTVDHFSRINSAILGIICLLKNVEFRDPILSFLDSFGDNEVVKRISFYVSIICRCLNTSDVFPQSISKKFEVQHSEWREDLVILDTFNHIEGVDRFSDTNAHELVDISALGFSYTIVIRCIASCMLQDSELIKKLEDESKLMEEFLAILFASLKEIVGKLGLSELVSEKIGGDEISSKAVKSALSIDRELEEQSEEVREWMSLWSEEEGSKKTDNSAVILLPSDYQSLTESVSFNYDRYNNFVFGSESDDLFGFNPVEFANYIRLVKAPKSKANRISQMGQRVSLGHLYRASIDGKSMKSKSGNRGRRIQNVKPSFHLLMDFSGSTGQSVRIRRGEYYSSSISVKLFYCIAKMAWKMRNALMHIGIDYTVWSHTATDFYVLRRLGVDPSVLRFSSGRWGSSSMPYAMLLESRKAGIMSSMDPQKNWWVPISKMTKDQNYDGLAIKGVAEYVEKEKFQNNIMVVLSDGQPSGNGGYYGKAAIDHTKESIAKLREGGWKVFGCTVVDESDIIRQNQEIYGMENHLIMTTSGFSETVKILLS